MNCPFIMLTANFRLTSRRYGWSGICHKIENYSRPVAAVEQSVFGNSKYTCNSFTLILSRRALKINGFLLFRSNYPEKRQTTDADGIEQGVVGNVSLLQNCTLSSQPVSSLDWCPDKQGLAVCTSFDQCLRVIITTKLNTY